MEEKEVIHDAIRSYEESIRFFSNTGKSNREIWVVNEFLKNLGIKFEYTELKTINQDVPDVIFRNEKFEIKEIDEKKRKRHDEYKKKLEKAKSSQNFKDLPTEYEFKEITMQEAINRINEEIKGLNYSPDFCRNTNILFYVNYSLIGKHHYEIPQEDTWLKWCSVSMVANNSISRVLYAATDAPAFIKSTIYNSCTDV